MKKMMVLVFSMAMAFILGIPALYAQEQDTQSAQSSTWQCPRMQQAGWKCPRVDAQGRWNCPGMGRGGNGFGRMRRGGVMPGQQAAPSVKQ